MGLVICPECGRQISDAAPACPQCGLPGVAFERRASPQPASPERNPAVTIAVLGVAGFISVVALVGVVAAVALPRFAAAPAEGVDAEIEALLGQLSAVQHAFLESNGTYAPHVDSLRSAGWDEPATRYYEFRVSSATDAAFCVDAVPMEGAGMEGTGPEGLEARSMDQLYTFYAGEGCTGDVLEPGIDFEDSSFDPAEPEAAEPNASGGA
jgi:Tfp pilus assembly protein PilE